MGRKNSYRLLYAKLKSFVSYMLIKQRLQNSSLHLPSSFDEGYTRTEGGRDGVRKAQELNCSQKHRWRVALCGV